MPSSWGNRRLLVVTFGLGLAALASRDMAVVQETARKCLAAGRHGDLQAGALQSRRFYKGVAWRLMVLRVFK